MRKEYQISSLQLKKLLDELGNSYKDKPEISRIRHLCKTVSSELPRGIAIREPRSILSSVIDLSVPYNLNPSIETEMHTVGGLDCTVKLSRDEERFEEPLGTAHIPVKFTFETGLQENADRIRQYFENVIVKLDERPRRSKSY